MARYGDILNALTWAGFVAAAAVGAPFRLVVDHLVARRISGRFPWGTFVVNATGSLLAGFLAGLGLYHSVGSAPRTVLATGFCGAYTTFSTSSVESVQLISEGAPAPALLNAAGTLLTCMFAAGIGLALAAA